MSILVACFFQVPDTRALGPTDNAHDMSQIASHPEPAWPWDSLVVADLSKHGMPGRFEQFWTKRVSDTVFEISCIPFFTYGIALGDTVKVDDNVVIQKVLQKSVHQTLRIAIAKTEKETVLHIAIHNWVSGTGLLYEWNGAGYLAVDLPPERRGQLDMGDLNELSRAEDIVFEIDDGSLTPP